LYTSEGIINIKNAKWRNNFDQIDPNGSAKVDTYYSRAYLRHLFQSKEYLGAQIASLHNVTFYLDLIRAARQHILDGNFTVWKTEMVAKLDKRL
jgi:queuine tRNA-ribosyltransferase